MFENYKIFKTDFAGRDLVVETGKIAQLANGACLIRYGETVVNVAVTASTEPRDGIDFFPLSVDFEEKMYAVGKIPGSFLKREGRPSEKAILVSRVIDRPIRPLFPKDMRNDVSVVCTVMSVDPDCSPEIAAMVGTSIALSISDIPWNGPISGVSVGLIDGNFIINPTAEQKKVSQMAVTVASTHNRIAMIEAGANEIDDETMFNGIMAGHKANQKIIEFIKTSKATAAILDFAKKHKLNLQSVKDIFILVLQFTENSDSEFLKVINSGAKTFTLATDIIEKTDKSTQTNTNKNIKMKSAFDTSSNTQQQITREL